MLDVPAGVRHALTGAEHVGRFPMLSAGISKLQRTKGFPRWALAIVGADEVSNLAGIVVGSVAEEEMVGVARLLGGWGVPGSGFTFRCRSNRASRLSEALEGNVRLGGCLWGESDWRKLLAGTDVSTLSKQYATHWSGHDVIPQYPLRHNRINLLERELGSRKPGL